MKKNVKTSSELQGQHHTKPKPERAIIVQPTKPAEPKKKAK
jgi:hypothetical protein